MKRLSLLLAIVMLAVSVSSSHAGFVDDWLTQSTVTNPSYFEGQKRDYFTAGSFSGRMQLSNDYLFTVMPPKLKSGCGGIDAFWGGFGFLNFDYLVKKLEKILQAAPAAAFDIALKNLCEPCSTVITKMEGLSNALNSVQLDDCKSAKAVAAYLMDPLAKDGSKEQKDLDEMQKQWWDSTGLETLYTKVTDLGKANNNNMLPGTLPSKMIEGCPQDIRDLIVENGSVLHGIGKKLGLDADYVNLFRGIVGDIRIIMKDDPQQATVSYEAFCDKNKVFSTDAFLNGTIEVKPLDAPCQPAADTNKNLRNYVRFQLTNVADAMKLKAAMPPSAQTFIENSPLATYKALKAAIAARSEAAIMEPLTEVTAHAIAVRMMEDMIGKITFGVMKFYEATSAMPSASPDKKAEECLINELGIEKQVTGLQQRATEVIAQIRQAHNNTVIEINNIFAMMRHMEELNNQTKRDIADRFGRAVSERVFK